MSALPQLNIRLLFRHFRWKIFFTWLLVLIENALWALVPLFIGRAIDALLAHKSGALWEISFVMTALVFVSVARRAHDTRAYGTMRVWFGSELVERINDRAVSQVNARLDMGREMVDFLEEHVPELITSITLITVSIVILWLYDLRLGLSALSVIALLFAVFALFHKRFFRINSELNAQTEHQVDILALRNKASLLTHLKSLRNSEVKLSDTEAILYGIIFSGMFAFIITNIWLASTISGVTAGIIFTILSYTWELIEAGVALPSVLQQWSRLSEIRQRLND